MEKITKLSKIISDVKKTSVGRSLIQLEAITKWPIPVVVNGRVYIKLLYFVTEATEAGKIAIYSPSVELTIDYQTEKIVKFTKIDHDPDYMGLKKGVLGYFPHDSVRKMKKSEYLAAQAETLQLLDDLINARIQNVAFPKEADDRLKYLLNLLVEPCLLDYYKKLNPKFIEGFINA